MPLNTNAEDLSSLLGEEFTEEGAVVPPEKWFEPSEGLRTVRGLLDALNEPAVPENARLAADDLKALEAVLEAAETQGVRFHLSPDL